MVKKLTIKQDNFCKQYILNGGNATAAYRMAYSVAGMQEASINVEASRLLDNPTVSLRIQELRERKTEKFLITKDYLNEELLQIISSMQELASEKNLSIGSKDLIRKTAMDLAKLNGLIIDKKEDVTDYGKLIDKFEQANNAPK